MINKLNFVTQFSESVLDIRTRLVVTLVPETKWMPNSDSASKLMPKCKILGQYYLPNYFYCCLKSPFSQIFIWLLHIGEESFLQICFHMESPYNS